MFNPPHPPTPLPYFKNPYLRDHEIYNFGIRFLGHHYNTLSLSEPGPRVKWPMWPHPSTRTAAQVVIKWFVIITLHLVCLNHDQEWRRLFLKSIHFHFYPQNHFPLALWGGGGSCNLEFLVPLPYKCYIWNLVKIGPVILEKKFP